MEARPLPVITLTSDFGEGSPYVAAMKGRLLEACPAATLVDVSHAVPAFDVAGGAFVLWAGTRHFTAGAVHLAVVDPGVGSSRRAVAFARDGSWYVGPDNGLFGLVLRLGTASAGGAAAGETAVVGVELARPAGASATFEGRDVFAPAAGALAAGSPPDSLGAALRSPLRELPLSPPYVLWVDAFGNLVTSLRAESDFPRHGIRVGETEVRETRRTFSEAPARSPFWYVGSMGFVEVAVREGRADRALEAGAGTPVSLL